MPVPWIFPGDPFPATSTALDEPNGLLAAGGDLSVSSLLAAYSKGIFPWYNDDQPILWWSPDPRMVLDPLQVHISRSLKKSARKQAFTVTFDEDFASVIEGCSLPRNGAPGTWITEEMKNAYLELHRAGYAHSVEVWKEGRLVGGLYGVGIDRTFFGESMFSLVPDASKYALAILCKHLVKWDIKLVDCQVANDHLSSLGAREIPRKDFEKKLAESCTDSSRQDWRYDEQISL